MTLVLALTTCFAATASADPTAAWWARASSSTTTSRRRSVSRAPSCHDPEHGFAHPDSSLPTSTGAVHDRFGNRNAPSAAYAAYSPTFHFEAKDETFVGGQFWDGRATSLEEQAKGRFLNPLEMNNADKASVVQKVRAASYAGRLKAVFGAEALTDVDQAYDAIAKAIAAFERSSEPSTRSPRSTTCAMSRVGPARMMTFTPQERQGMMLFNNMGMMGGKAKCSTCHVTPMSGQGSRHGRRRHGRRRMVRRAMGGMPVRADGAHLLQRLPLRRPGDPKNWESPYLGHACRRSTPRAWPGWTTGSPRTCPAASPPTVPTTGMFRTPSLRNVAVTAPYGHNGYFTDAQAGRALLQHARRGRRRVARRALAGARGSSTMESAADRRPRSHERRGGRHRGVPHDAHGRRAGRRRDVSCPVP